MFRASDGGIVWSDAYRSDGTMAVLLRTGQRIPTRAERAAELEEKIAGAPATGTRSRSGWPRWATRRRPATSSGAMASLRFHERFGENMANLFGLSAGIFTTGPPSEDKHPQALNTIMLGAYYSHDMSEPNLNHPEAWIYGEGGGMFSGNQGNTFYLRERRRRAPQVAAVARRRAALHVPHEVRGVRSRRHGLPPPRRHELVTGVMMKKTTKTSSTVDAGRCCRSPVMTDAAARRGPCRPTCGSRPSSCAGRRTPPRGEPPRSRYVVRMTDGQRDWEIQLPGDRDRLRGAGAALGKAGQAAWGSTWPRRPPPIARSSPSATGNARGDDGERRPRRRHRGRDGKDKRQGRDARETRREDRRASRRSRPAPTSRSASGPATC